MLVLYISKEQTNLRNQEHPNFSFEEANEIQQTFGLFKSMEVGKLIQMN